MEMATDATCIRLGERTLDAVAPGEPGSASNGNAAASRFCCLAMNCLGERVKGIGIHLRCK